MSSTFILLLLLSHHIQFTAPDKELGVSNRDLAMIESIANDGRIAVRFADNFAVWSAIRK